MKDGAIRELSDIAARVDMRANGADPAAHPEATGKAVDAWAELFIAAIDERVAAHGKPADDAPRGDGGEAALARANMSPAPVPADAAEVARLRDTLAAAQSTLAGIRSALRCSGSVGLVEWATKIREDLDAAETTVVEGTEILNEARAALNCGLTAEQRNALTLCRLLGADCAACRLARRDIAVADLRVRLRGAEQQIDKRDADAAKIRGALGCRNGETTLDVARRVPELIRSLIADKAQLAADVVETRRGLDCGASPETRAYGCMNGDRCETCETARVMRQSDGYRRERDAYHANARANGEQRDRFAADLGRLLRAVDAIGNLLTVHGSIAYVLAEAKRIRDGGAPVDPRDAEIARLTRERDDWRRCCDAARAERSAYHGAAMAEEARANDAEREREAMARALEVNAGLFRDAVAARDALVAAGVALRDAKTNGEEVEAYGAMIDMLPAKSPAITYGGPQPQSEAT